MMPGDQPVQLPTIHANALLAHRMINEVDFRFIVADWRHQWYWLCAGPGAPSQPGTVVCAVHTLRVKLTRRMRFNFRLAAQFAAVRPMLPKQNDAGPRSLSTICVSWARAVVVNPKLRLPVLFMVTSDKTNKPPSANDLPQASLPHSEVPAEPHEHLKQKQMEPEKFTGDIVFQRALTDWIITHRSKWCHARLPDSQQNRISP
jgi:hypothetical protein